MKLSNISPRVSQILQILLEQNAPISVKALAEQMNLSKRTIQREMDSINTILKGYEITLNSKTGVGIWLEGSEDKKQELRHDLSMDDRLDVSNREERRKRLTLEILKEKELRKLFYYSSRFQVSEATISADLEAIEGWLTRYGLRITRKPGSGISISGSEEAYRRAIRAFINENIDTHILREAYESTESDAEGYASLQYGDIGKILNDDIVKRVIACLSGMDNTRVMTLTESSYVGLVIHIAIAINRILKDEVIDTDASWQQGLVEDADYHLAEQIVEELEEEFEIEIPAVEVSYICLHIKGAKHEKIQWDGQKINAIENRELRGLLNEMVDAFDPESAYLLKQDEEFIQGLLAHLRPTLIRLDHGMQIQNPVLDDIKQNYTDIYQKCLNVSKVLEHFTGKPVPEEETGFLTVHFGAAMVRQEGRKEEIRQVDVGIVCSSGIGISRLMLSKLNKLFGDRVNLTAYGKNDITSYVQGKTDFFVSSLPIEKAEIPVIHVNPLLNEEDIDQIRKMIYQYQRMPTKHKQEDLFSVQLDQINQMAAQINIVIKDMELFHVDVDITFEELLHQIGERLSPYSDRSQIIQEDLMRREQVSSQIFAEFGFALLHTRTKGVTRPVFAVCMPEGNAAFVDPYFKQITVAFVMLVPNDELVKINNDIMGHISGMLIEEPEFMEVAEQGDKEQIRTLLSKHLKQYFRKYISGLS